MRRCAWLGGGGIIAHASRSASGSPSAFQCFWHSTSDGRQWTLDWDIKNYNEFKDVERRDDLELLGTCD
ncbi:hypothetical protein K0M31_001884 [Melipona bicolor]|uniref:Uncharacterized protein n=1 Tax=Melipona bicolor TaxID=60889 RepID=A0AA40KYK2_9HYME|nr:hypothetical protein K0M31_001884 [Melipona bicolor]